MVQWEWEQPIAGFQSENMNMLRLQYQSGLQYPAVWTRRKLPRLSSCSTSCSTNGATSTDDDVLALSELAVLWSRLSLLAARERRESVEHAGLVQKNTLGMADGSSRRLARVCPKHESNNEKDIKHTIYKCHF